MLLISQLLHSVLSGSAPSSSAIFHSAVRIVGILWAVMVTSQTLVYPDACRKAPASLNEEKRKLVVYKIS